MPSSCALPLPGPWRSGKGTWCVWEGVSELGDLAVIPLLCSADLEF